MIKSREEEIFVFNQLMQMTEETRIARKKMREEQDKTNKAKELRVYPMTPDESYIK